VRTPKPIHPLPVQHRLTIFVNDSWFLPLSQARLLTGSGLSFCCR
jgi:hypothetical protein